MWRLFRGCGHSFHIECLLPDISVCKICKEDLAAKIEKLSKSCNDAVFAVDHNEPMGPSDDEENEDEDEFPFVENEEMESLGLTNDRHANDQCVEELRKKIFSWRAAASPAR